jgi:hypothetical protein
LDAFVKLVSEILWMEGYWVRTSVKVDLTKEEKHLIGRLSLACGKVRNDGDRAAIRAPFAAQSRELCDEERLRERLQRMTQQGYENQVSAVVAKLLLRRKVE